MPTASSFTAALLLAAPALVHGAVEADRVSVLPGYGAPPTAHFSGLIPTGKETNSTGQLHYWLVTAEQSDAPITLWLNGCFLASLLPLSSFLPCASDPHGTTFLLLRRPRLLFPHRASDGKRPCSYQPEQSQEPD